MLTLEYAGTDIPITYISFPCGEEHVRIDHCAIINNPVKIVARLTNSTEIMRMVLLVDAVKNQFLSHGCIAEINLVIPYFPYARQDRVAVSGEPLSARVMASIVNQLECKTVTVLDPHSYVTEAVIKNLHVVNQSDCIGRSSDLLKIISDPSTILVAPDAGASKKIFSLSEDYSKTQYPASKVMVLDKTRDPISGNITGMKYSYGNSDISGKTVLIADDICDGGRTFIEAAKVLRDMGASKIILYVTHGVFTKGVHVLFPYIDEIYTTNSYHSSAISPDVNYIDVISTLF